LRQLGPGRGFKAAQAMECARSARHHERTCHLSAVAEELGDLCDLRHVEALEDGHGPVPLGADRRLESLPGQVPRRLDRLFVRGLPTLELRLARDSRLDDPVTHTGDAVELVLEAEAFLGLVPLVTPARRR